MELISIQAFAKSLQVGPNQMFKWLRRNKYIYKHDGEHNIPFQSQINAGNMILKIKSVKLGNGERITAYRTFLTPKGMVFIEQAFWREMERP